MCIDGDGYGDTQELANLIPDALNYEFFNYWRLSYSYQYKVGYDAVCSVIFRDSGSGAPRRRGEHEWLGLHGQWR